MSPNKTDNFFRQALSSAPDLSPSEKDWKDMERLLKGEPKRRPVIAWFYWPAGIAAGLLIFFSIWFSKAPVTQLAESRKVESKKGESGKMENEKEGKIQETNLTGSTNTGQVQASGQNAILSKAVNGKKIQNTINIQNQNAGISENREQLPAINYALNKSFRTIYSINFDHIPAITSVTLKSKIENRSTSNAPRTESSIEKPNGKLALSMAFTTDMNSVNGIGNSKAGLSGGFGISYKISKGISAGTGIYYSRKKYTSDKASYNTIEKPFATWASYSRQIDADCKVIDIPLNLNVLVSKTKRTGIIASAGLSSYIMLSEKYNFIYNPTPAYPSAGREYTIKNANQHILSIVNLSVGVEKPLGKQSSIVIQPYAKLPMTGIGQGKTELKSFGVGFQLNYSMKKKNKFFNRKSE